MAAILLFSHKEHVVDLIFNLFPDTGKHRRVGFQTKLVSDSTDSNQVSAGVFFTAILCRTVSAKISAPPPGIESKPAAIKRFRVSS